MKTLTVKLKQHTPLIHFQHDQYGATLRASEVKPKLDRFLIEKSENGDFEEWKELFVGYSEKNEGVLREKFENNNFKALDYKIIIEPNEKIELNLNPREQWNQQKQKNMWVTDDFPLVLSNMGGKDTQEELVGFSMYSTVKMKFVSKHEELLEYISDWIDLFFAERNFGQRQDKGFGSFSVIEVDGKRKPYPKDDLSGTYYLKLVSNTIRQNMDGFTQLFGTIDFYWKTLKSGINYTRNGNYPQRYIKSFLWKYLDNNNHTWEKRKVKQNFNLLTNREVNENNNQASFARALLGCPDKFEYKNFGRVVFVNHNNQTGQKKDLISRIPSPIIFKPIYDEQTTVWRIYLIINDDPIVALCQRDDNLEFLFTCDNESMTMQIDPHAITLRELIKQYHDFLGKDVCDKAFQDEQQRDMFLQNNEIDDDRIKWFIPLNFNWRNILQNKWVEMYKIK